MGGPRVIGGGTRRRFDRRDRQRQFGRRAARRDSVAVESWGDRRCSEHRDRRTRRVSVHPAGAGQLLGKSRPRGLPERAAGTDRRQLGHDDARRPAPRDRRAGGDRHRLRPGAADRYDADAQADRHDARDAGPAAVAQRRLGDCADGAGGRHEQVRRRRLGDVLAVLRADLRQHRQRARLHDRRHGRDLGRRRRVRDQLPRRAHVPGSQPADRQRRPRNRPRAG